MKSQFKCPLCDQPLTRLDSPSPQMPVVLFCGNLSCEDKSKADGLTAGWEAANAGAVGATEIVAFNALRANIDKEANV